MKLHSFVRLLVTAADYLRSPFLLCVRLFWGWQFMQTGWGKLMNLERTAGFFASLGIPHPHLNAVMAGGVECFGGVLLMAGLGARFAALPLCFAMLVAYWTAEREALMAAFSDPGKLTAAAPFPFLLVSLIILCFGAGCFSLDHLIARKTGCEKVSDIH